ncbi:alpha-amylase family glycosyl hydrolase [Tropicibacter oceani]|uniref:Alpha-amylase family glycosyl hydrolase n=1 Tax=Tropicibacter oceani TaxID=3058420 RepID=A0ABY8QQ19_9RHOB|nr:alpha-amylase family glycosyl hydrolase [Tropicibacter oceani]WGW05922.1 alpha-amylase family glycosyl hydrolase [Tropicibacter oceani]
MAARVPEPDIFDLRLARSAGDLWPMLEQLYGAHPAYAQMQDDLRDAMRSAWKARPADLRTLDLQRDLEPDWFQRPDMVGYVFYIDRFAGDLKGVHDRLDYLQSLGVTYVHLMPCLKPRPGDSDGGYSVMDYRQVNPAYGTMADLQALAQALRARGMSLCIDMVLNHTAKEHDWAVQAARGDAAHQDMYLMFDDDRLPKAYEKTLIEIFPDNAPGSFTYYEGLDKWVWTTFNEHQWDLNWANPRVFLEIAKIMLFLANQGVDVLRLDAVAFMWKRMGTRCQSEPEVHMILRALRAVTRIVAASVLHLEEAIVGPAEMLTYFGRGEHDGREGNLAYHNNLMVQFWSALATRDTGLMTHVLRSHFPETLTNATYATYIRCHDDIGWAITDEDAGALGLTGHGHRGFLADFYEGVFPGSFARGALFQVNEETGDKRVSGSFASLAGLERALDRADAQGMELAVHRILLGNALIASFGGVPLIYMGDEIALTNDYGYLQVPEHAHDSRWINRPHMDWDRAASAETGTGPEAQVLQGTRHIYARRKATPQIHGGYPTRILDSGQKSVFAFGRIAPTGTLLCLFNFSETWQHLPLDWLRAQGVVHFHDALSDAAVSLDPDTYALPPLGRVWLT